VSEHCKNHLHEHLRKAVARHLNQEKKPSQVFQHIGSLKGHGCSPRSSAGADNDDIGPEKVEVGIRAALIDSFLSIDKELFKKGTAKEMGTTAVVALIGPSHLWVANCGEHNLGWKTTGMVMFPAHDSRSPAHTTSMIVCCTQAILEQLCLVDIV